MCLPTNQQIGAKATRSNKAPKPKRYEPKDSYAADDDETPISSLFYLKDYLYSVDLYDPVEETEASRKEVEEDGGPDAIYDPKKDKTVVPDSEKETEDSDGMSDITPAQLVEEVEEVQQKIVRDQVLKAREIKSGKQSAVAEGKEETEEKGVKNEQETFKEKLRQRKQVTYKERSRPTSYCFSADRDLYDKVTRSIHSPAQTAAGTSQAEAGSSKPLTRKKTSTSKTPREETALNDSFIISEDSSEDENLRALTPSSETTDPSRCSSELSGSELESYMDEEKKKRDEWLKQKKKEDHKAEFEETTEESEGAGKQASKRNRPRKRKSVAVPKSTRSRTLTPGRDSSSSSAGGSTSKRKRKQRRQPKSK